MQTNQPAQPSPPISDMQLKVLLHQYETIIGLYKHHLESIIKINIFLYAVTGAIVSFYFSQPCSGLIKYSLIFPCVMNLAYAIFFFDASNNIHPWDTDIKAIAATLGLISYPSVMTLKKILRLSAILFILVFIGLALLTILR